MRALRVVLLAAIAALLLLVPAGTAFGAIEILNRGVTPDPGVVNGTATVTVDVKVGQAPYIVEFYCCDFFSIDRAAPSKYIDENSAETQGLSGTHSFTFNVGPGGQNATDRIVIVRVTDSNGDQRTERFGFQNPLPPR